MLSLKMSCGKPRLSWKTVKKLDNNSSGANKELESPNLIIIAIEEHLIRPNLVVNSSLCIHNVHLVVKRLPEVRQLLLCKNEVL